MDRRPTQQSHGDLPHKFGMLILPPFDASRKSIAQAWAQKLDTYLSLSPMLEEEVIKLAILHLVAIEHSGGITG